MSETAGSGRDLSIAVDQPGLYRFKVQGRLSAGLERRFDEMTITVERNSAGVPVTTLSGPVTDQAALYGVIAHIRDAGLPLVLVELMSTIEQEG